MLKLTTKLPQFLNSSDTEVLSVPTGHIGAMTIDHGAG
jgi:hypothetical protein